MDESKYIKSELHNLIACIRTNSIIKSNIALYSIITSESISNINEQKLLLSIKKSLLSNKKVSSQCYVETFRDVVKMPDYNESLLLLTMGVVSKIIQNSFIKKDAFGEKIIENVIISLLGLKEKSDLVKMKKIKILKTIATTKYGEFISKKNFIEIFKYNFVVRMTSHESLLIKRFSEDSLMEILMYFFRSLQKNRKIKKQVISKKNISKLKKILLYLNTTIESYCSSKETIMLTKRIIFGLKCFKTVIDSGSDTLNLIPDCSAIMTDFLCKNLLHCSQSKNIKIYLLTLRMFYLLICNFKHKLRVQLEIFFKSIIFRALESKNSENWRKHLTLEFLYEFCGNSKLVVEIFTNFDLEVNFINLFEELTEVLANLCLGNKVDSDNENQNYKAISGECLIQLARAIKMYLKSEYHGIKKVEKLKHIKASSDGDMVEIAIENKKKVSNGIELFNRDGEKSFDYLRNINLLDKELTPRSISLFLKNTININKQKVFKILSGNNNRSKAILEEYLDTFNFKDDEMDRSLREFLGSFTLKGESQQILRVLEAFSKKFYAQNDTVFRSVDACYVVVSAIIMLNTDFYNEKIETKISLPKFKNILKGINEGENIPESYIEKLYFSIKKSELKSIPHNLGCIVTEKGVDKTHWKYVLKNSKNYWNTNAKRGHLKRMFFLVKDPLLHTLGFSLKRISNNGILRLLADEIKIYAELCNEFMFWKNINKLIIVISTTLIEFLERLSSNSFGVDNLEINFKKSSFGESLVELFFYLVFHFGTGSIEEAWRHVLLVIFTLNEFGIIPKKHSYSADKAKNNNGAVKTTKNYTIEKIFSNNFKESCLVSLLDTINIILKKDNFEDIISHHVGRFLSRKKYKDICVKSITYLGKKHLERIPIIWKITGDNILCLLTGINSVTIETEKLLNEVFELISLIFQNEKDSSSRDEQHILTLEKMILKNYKVFDAFLNMPEDSFKHYQDRIFFWFCACLKSLCSQKTEGLLKFAEKEKNDEKINATDQRKSQKGWEIMLQLTARLVMSNEDCSASLELVGFITSNFVQKNNYCLCVDLLSLLNRSELCDDILVFKTLETIYINFSKTKIILDEEERINSMKKLTGFVYGIIIENSKENNSVLSCVKMCALDLLGKLFNSNRNLLEKNPGLVEECIDEIIRPLINYCYTFEIYKLDPYIKKDKDLKIDDKSTLISSFKLMSLLLSFLGLSSYKEDRFESSVGKYLKLCQRYAENFYEKSKDNTFIKQYLEVLKYYINKVFDLNEAPLGHSHAFKKKACLRLYKHFSNYPNVLRKNLLNVDCFELIRGKEETKN